MGRRLAFDAAKGRLWVVCSGCSRWNLTPLEERWEAIEDAERLYRDTRLRSSTENIGLARLQDGTDLVRIGKPQLPEFAAWRYGAQFTKRRNSMLIGGLAGAATFGSVAVLTPLVGAAGSAVAGMVGIGVMTAASRGITHGNSLFLQKFIRDEEGQYLSVARGELQFVCLTGDATRWGLRVPYRARRAAPVHHASDWINKGFSKIEVTLHGDAALEAARQLLPMVNGNGAGKSVVNDAVQLMTEWGTPESAFAHATSRIHEWGMKQSFGDTGALSFLPKAVRLALEMSAHENQERRAMEGELADLEREWKDAEEIAAIADDLLTPGPVARAFARLKSSLGSGTSR